MLEIEIVQAYCNELKAQLGPAGLAEFAPAIHEGAKPDRLACVAILRRGDHRLLLDACFPCGKPITLRRDLVPYHAWHGEQVAVSFWQAAYSWSLYWHTVQQGELGDPCWMDFLMTPMPGTPLLSFLDLSCGRFAWGFQLELAYRLADDNLDRSVAFRKGWNAQTPDAVRLACDLRLPDGSTIMESIQAHPPYAFPSVTSPPVRPAQLLLKL